MLLFGFEDRYRFFHPLCIQGFVCPHFEKLHSDSGGTFCEVKALSKPHLEAGGANQ
jgi:hypothetical protein